jgi:MIP family channel proteins
MDAQLTRKAIVEFIGTFALCFMGIGAIIMTEGENLVAIALAHGLAIGVSVMAAGHISGGFFNPAVTIAMGVTRKINWYGAGVYVVAQLLGAVAACLVLLATFPESMRDVVGLGTPAVGSAYSTGNALVAEIVATFFLLFVIFGVAVDQRSAKGLGGLVIGLTISMAIFATGAIGGAALNSARWFGPALVDTNFDDFWIWIVGPIVGAVAAALVFNDVLMVDDELPEGGKPNRRARR